MKQRNHAFDLLCGICIIRMIMLHITNACGFGKLDWWVEVMQWSYYFMSFFFFKAGYFNKTVAGNSKEFCIKKFKQLMVPYFVWGFIGNASYFFFVWFIFDPANALSKQVEIKHIWESSQFYGNIPCWFLFSFFIAYLVAHFIAKIPPLFRIPLPKTTKRPNDQIPKRPVLNVKIHWIILAFPFISYWAWSKGNPLWFGLDNVFIGIYLFYLGRLWHIAMERFGRESSIVVSVFMLVVFAFLNFTFRGSYTMVDNIWVGNPVITVISITLALCGLSGILLNVNIPRIPVLCYIGQHSMVFFVAHYPIMMFYKMVRSANVRTLRGHWDDYTILIFMIFTICFLLVPYVEKVPWLSGRFNGKKILPNLFCKKENEKFI